MFLRTVQGMNIFLLSFCIVLLCHLDSCRSSSHHHRSNDGPNVIDVDLHKLQEHFRSSYLGKDGCLLITPGEALSSIVLASERDSILHEVIETSFNAKMASHKKKYPKYSTHHYPRIIFQTPCLDRDSFGNRLGFYIEARLCARALGAHYVASEMTNSSDSIDILFPPHSPPSPSSPPSPPSSTHSRDNKIDPFFSSLASVVKHTHPVGLTWTDNGNTTRVQMINELEIVCPCGIYCHEDKNALMFRQDNLPFIRKLFLHALDSQLQSMNISTKIPTTFQLETDEGMTDITGMTVSSSITNEVDNSNNDNNGVLSGMWSIGTYIYHWIKHMYLHNNRVSTSLQQQQQQQQRQQQQQQRQQQRGSQFPLIPDVALHFRCGDNKYYGIMNFASYLSRIPTNSRTVYIMTEDAHRKTDERTRHYCTEIVFSLKRYLMQRLPRQTSVLLIRGQNIYLDMARLTYANVTICSVSTFCLWPALANSHRVYYPTTRLIANATKPYIHSEFQWIDTPVVKHFTNIELDQLLKYLMRD